MAQITEEAYLLCFYLLYIVQNQAKNWKEDQFVMQIKCLRFEMLNIIFLKLLNINNLILFFLN